MLRANCYKPDNSRGNKIIQSRKKKKRKERDLGFTFSLSLESSLFTRPIQETGHFRLTNQPTAPYQRFDFRQAAGRLTNKSKKI